MVMAATEMGCGWQDMVCISPLEPLFSVSQFSEKKVRKKLNSLLENTCPNLTKDSMNIEIMYLNQLQQ